MKKKTVSREKQLRTKLRAILLEIAATNPAKAEELLAFGRELAEQRRRRA